MGERVRTRREALRISQEALAHRSGIHWTFVGQVERGQRNISLHNLLKLAAGLEVDASELVRGLVPPLSTKEPRSLDSRHVEDSESAEGRGM